MKIDTSGESTNKEITCDTSSENNNEEFCCASSEYNRKVRRYAKKHNVSLIKAFNKIYKK